MIGTGATRATALALVLAVAACARGEPDLINPSRGQDTPDEFGILPTKPIEIPDRLDLPPPAPGAGNRVDPTPQADAVAALGGDPGRLRGTGQPRGPADLMRAAGRHGVEPGVRERLAREDYAIRDRNRGRVLERLFGVTTYYRAYSDQSLDQYEMLERSRQAGARTPAAPPEATLD